MKLSSLLVIDLELELSQNQLRSPKPELQFPSQYLGLQMGVQLVISEGSCKEGPLQEHVNTTHSLGGQLQPSRRDGQPPEVWGEGGKWNKGESKNQCGEVPGRFPSVEMAKSREERDTGRARKRGGSQL